MKLESNSVHEIGKRLNVIESNSVHRSRPKVKKSVCKPVAASSNLTASHGEDDLRKKCTKLTHNVP